MVEQQLQLQNGIAADDIRDFVGAIARDPEGGAVRVRSRQTWDDAFAFDVQIESFEQAGEVFPRTHHTLRTDWPPPLGGDSGPTPGAELILSSLGACVATTYIVKATTLGVTIDELEVIVEGDVDLRGLFELGDVVPRFSEIAVTLSVRSDADDDQIQKLGQITTRTSPVFDSLTHPVPLQLDVQRFS